jgi:hypothetical protein
MFSWDRYKVYYMARLIMNTLVDGSFRGYLLRKVGGSTPHGYQLFFFVFYFLVVAPCMLLRQYFVLHLLTVRVTFQLHSKVFILSTHT